MKLHLCDRQRWNMYASHLEHDAATHVMLAVQTSVFVLDFPLSWRHASHDMHSSEQEDGFARGSGIMLLVCDQCVLQR